MTILVCKMNLLHRARFIVIHILFWYKVTSLGLVIRMKGIVIIVEIIRLLSIPLWQGISITKSGIRPQE